MTSKFDTLVEFLIREYTTAKSKRQESRYWKPGKMSNSAVRQVRMMNNKSASQRTKLGNQQYVGNYWGDKGIRTQNKSEKNIAQAGISKGLGNHLKIQGVNPKKPGTKVNSKQGNMEVKYVMNNGAAKIGPTGKTDFNFSKPRHFKDDK